MADHNAKEAIAIRQKYAQMRSKLDDCFARGLPYERKRLDEAGYRIARRNIVLLRQKELLEGGFLDNDERLDENDKPTGTYELDGINKELTEGVQDRALVCPHDPYPHNPYPIRVAING